MNQSPTERPVPHQVAGELAPALAQLARLLDDPHVTRVAGRSGISQPTLSRSMARWEQLTGLQLFEKRGRAVALTAEGADVARAAAAALARLEADLGIILRSPAPRTLAIGFMRSLGPAVVSELVGAFHAAEPSVLVVQRDGAIGALLEELEAGTLDVAVVAPRPDRRFAWLPLGQQALTLVVPAHHRLAEAEVLDLGEARDEAFLALDTRFATRIQADRLCEAAGFAPRIEMVADSASTIRDYVAAGLGIAILPVDTAVDRRVRSIMIDSPDSVRAVGIASLPGARFGALGETFHEIARGLDRRFPGWADLLAG